MVVASVILVRLSLNHHVVPGWLKCFDHLEESSEGRHMMAQQWMDENDPRLLEEVEKARRMAEKYAAHSGYALNPDQEALAGIYRGLARNKLQYGHRYCP